MSIYSYSIVDNLGGDYDVSLYDIINANAIISSDAICVGTQEDGNGNLELHFTNSLSPTSETALNGIILNYNYVAPTPLKINYIPMTIAVHSVSSANYTTISSQIYPNLGDIQAIDFVGYMDNGVTSYDVLILNKNNNSIIAEQNFTNRSSSIQSFASILNQPTNTELTNIEVCVKINKNGNSKKYAYISSGMLWVN